MSRTSNSIRNIKYAVVGQAVGLVISFFTRTIFVQILSVEYLGLNGLFSNILSMLSFAELGVGTAITYSLYKPLADKNEVKIKTLMRLYQQAYTAIGVTIAALGVTLTPFLEFLIKDMPDIPYIREIYLMFVANSVISYFFSYRRSLIIADQMRYIVTVYHYGFYVGLNIAQILILLVTHNYILYIGLQLLNTLLENIILSHKAGKLFPFIKGKSKESLDAKEKSTIVRNVKAMMLHKIGDIVVLGTDNLLLSKFIGIVVVGMYSNYLMITNALNTVFGLMFQALTASIGNLSITDTKERTKFIFSCIDFIGFWIYSFASISLVNLFNPFIRLWLGEEYLFSMPLVLLIITNFYLTGMRKSVITFRDALGLYWYDRYKPLFEAGINLMVSIILVRQIGTEGIFIGTAVSTLTTCFWVEPYMLYKHGFKSSAIPYFVRYVQYTSLMLLAGGATWFACSLFNGTDLTAFIGKMVMCVFAPNAIFIAAFWRRKEFRYLLGVFKPIALNFFRR